MTFEPMPLSMANAAILQEWQKKLEDYIAATSKDRIMAAISKMYEQDLEFRELVDATIQGGGTFDEAMLAQWAKQNLVKATQLQNMVNQLPHTLSALQLGIDCIKATADKAKLQGVTEEEFATDGFWHHVTFDDVQNYTNKLLDMR